MGWWRGHYSWLRSRDLNRPAFLLLVRTLRLIKHLILAAGGPKLTGRHKGTHMPSLGAESQALGG